MQPAYRHAASRSGHASYRFRTESLQCAGAGSSGQYTVLCSATHAHKRNAFKGSRSFRYSDRGISCC